METTMMAVPPGAVEDYVEIDLIDIEPEYQRPLREAFARGMAAAWDDDAAGVLYLAALGGRYVVLDGQHRLAAMRLLGLNLAPARIYPDTDKQRRAQLFAIFNSKRVNARPIDVYRAELLAGDDQARRIDAFARASGVTLGDGTGHNRTQAVQAFRRLDNAGTLNAALRAVREAWRRNGTYLPGALNGNVLGAVGDFIKASREHPAYDAERLATALSQHTPDELIAALRRLRTGYGLPSRAAITAWYNNRLKPENRLPETLV